MRKEEEEELAPRQEKDKLKVKLPCQPMCWRKKKSALCVTIYPISNTQHSEQLPADTC